MLRLLEDTTPGSRRGNRREVLRVGGLALGGLSLADLLAHRAQAAPAADTTVSRAFGRAKSVIVIFLGGGPPQHETWDPKPEAPPEIRGGFGTIASQTPGLLVGELMPMTARHTDKIAVLRAMVTNDNAHSTSGYQMMTGVPHVPLNVENAVSRAPNLAPHWGSLAKYLTRGTRPGFPPAITLPNRIANVGEIVWPGQIGGVLGPQYDPWLLTCDPSKPDFQVPDLALPADLSSGRLGERLALLDRVNEQLGRAADSSAVNGFNRQTQQALELLSGTRAREAFDLSRESVATRDRYGRSRWAQSVLLARRLVEAGVSLVQINWCNIEGEPNAGSWDTHDRHNDLLKRFLMPWMDQAYSALISDLKERGLLETTLVVAWGEFGRTPRVNNDAGRDHYPNVFSAALAGGPSPGGRVLGASDTKGAFPLSQPKTPQDVLATMYRHLGVDATRQYVNAAGRPIGVLPSGSPLVEW